MSVGQESLKSSGRSGDDQARAGRDMMILRRQNHAFGPQNWAIRFDFPEGRPARAGPTNQQVPAAMTKPASP
jgi:hypothetical protein